MIQYKENPFYLTEEQVQWVESTYDSMSLEEKIEFFQMLLDVGFKQIEVGFPAASEGKNRTAFLPDRIYER